MIWNFPVFVTVKTMYLNSKLGDFSLAIILNGGQFSVGDKPRPYLSGETPFVVAGFYPRLKGAEY
jgi:hypothetical protein